MKNTPTLNTKKRRERTADLIKFFNSNDMYSYILVAIYVLASGATSFLVLAIGNRNLDQNSFRQFLLNWNFINVSMLVLLSPIEALAPKLLHNVSFASLNLKTLKFWARNSAIFVAVIVIILNFYRFNDTPFFNFVVITGYISVLAETYIARSKLVASGDFKSMAGTAVISAVISFVLFFAFEITNSITIASMYFCVAAGLVSGLVFLYYSNVKIRAHKDSYGSKKVGTLNKEVLIRLTQMSFTAFIQLGLGMTGVTILAILGATKIELFTYSALSGLALICLGFVNSAAVPMSKQIAAISDLIDVGQYRIIFYRNIAIYFAGFIATIVFSITIRSVFLEVLAGSSLEVSKTRTILTVVAIGAECMIVVPKVVLIGLGRETQILYIWATGFLVYIASMFLPFSPYTRVCVAIINSGFFIFLASSILAIYSISKLQIHQPERNDVV